MHALVKPPRAELRSTNSTAMPLMVEASDVCELIRLRREFILLSLCWAGLAWPSNLVYDYLSACAIEKGKHFSNNFWA